MDAARLRAYDMLDKADASRVWLVHSLGAGRVEQWTVNGRPLILHFDHDGTLCYYLPAHDQTWAGFSTTLARLNSLRKQVSRAQPDSLTEDDPL